MNRTKTHNSLIFLTTLSIYLGLVVVGSSPTVLAYAATTPRFEIRSEAEVEDDLDKKPDSDAPVFETYFDTLAVLIDELAALESSGQFDSVTEKFRSTYGESVTCGSDPERRRLWVWQAIDNEAVQSVLTGVFKRFSDSFGAGECAFSESDPQIGQRRSEFRISVENGTYEFAFQFSKPTQSDAAAFIARFAGKAAETSPESTGTRTLVGRNSTFHQENNQVFVITRLPRAAL